MILLKKGQSRLHYSFQWIIRAIVMVSLVFIGFNSNSSDTLYGVVLFTYAIGAIENFIHRLKLSNVVWNYAKQNFAVVDDEMIMYAAGPIVTGDAQNVSFERIASIKTADNRLLQLADINVTRDFFDAINSSMTRYSMSYLVLGVKLDVQTPHIFIDGRSQNRFKARSADLWSLTSRLNQSEKLQDLEGDFYKYFDVYTADREYLSALTILAPDVMLRLRDKGYSFDYEIFDGNLYVIHDANIASAEESEKFFSALFSCLDELVPQITKHSYADASKNLQLSQGKTHLWALLHSARVIARKLAWISLWLIIGVSIGIIWRMLWKF